jgi:hypothetical protein
MDSGFLADARPRNDARSISGKFSTRPTSELAIIYEGASLTFPGRRTGLGQCSRMPKTWIFRPKAAVSAVFTSKLRQSGEQTNKRQNIANQIKLFESN